MKAHPSMGDKSQKLDPEDPYMICRQCLCKLLQLVESTTELLQPCHFQASKFHEHPKLLGPAQCSKRGC